MIAEFLMDRFNWEAVWSPGLRRGRLGTFIRARWFVGTWTGPQHDLICVRKCATNEEAHRLKSPHGRTILHAALRSAWVLWTTR